MVFFCGAQSAKRSRQLAVGSWQLAIVNFHFCSFPTFQSSNFPVFKPSNIPVFQHSYLPLFPLHQRENPFFG